MQGRMSSAREKEEAEEVEGANGGDPGVW